MMKKWLPGPSVSACDVGAAGALLPPSAVSGLLRKAPPHSGWPKLWHRPRQPLDTRSPPPNSVQLCTYCIGAAKLCLLIFFVFLTVG